MSVIRDAIIFLPPFNTDTLSSENFNCLIDSIKTKQKIAKIKVIKNGYIKGLKGVRLDVEYYNGVKKKLDVFDASSKEYDTHLQEIDLKSRLLKGISILSYWFFSKVWLAWRESLYMVVGISMISFAMLLWFSLIVVIVLTLIMQETNPSIFGMSLPISAVTFIVKFKHETAWQLYLVIIILRKFMPIDSIIDMAYFMKYYLQDEVLRHTMRNNFANIFNVVSKDKDYRGITILLNKGGAFIGIDFFANYHPVKRDKNIRFISVASIVGFFEYRAKWLRDELTKCQNNTAISSWIDFYSKNSCFCSRMPDKGSSVKITHKDLTSSSSFLQIIRISSTNIYFREPVVINEILEYNY